MIHIYTHIIYVYVFGNVSFVHARSSGTASYLVPIVLNIYIWYYIAHAKYYCASVHVRVYECG